MQVTHTEDHVTSVTISNEKPIEFGITNDASFFHILSSTLYKDQKLAVVRETLCNAWDIHIECGVTHKPVEVTIDDEKIIIKDYGKGIHKDDMGLIYGTYGNSTKKNDGNQTGGFGLGCKSPFAYTDHFDVQSCHDGVRTIYNLNKSSGQTNGKPTINPIVSVPTTETGLQVTIPIKKEDKRQFASLFDRIASNGNMNVIINGEEVEQKLVIDPSMGFLITNRTNILHNQTKVMIRYGNVVYPLNWDQNLGFASSMNKVINHIDRLGRGSGQHYIIFQAKPHSIAVTPSREELSMQEHTVNSLNELFENFMEQVNKNFLKEANSQIEHIIKDAVHRGDTKALLSWHTALPYGGKSAEDREKLQQRWQRERTNVTSWAEQVNLYLLNHYPDIDGFQMKDIELRLREMIKANLGDKGLLQSYLKELKLHNSPSYKRTNTPFSYRKHNWLSRKVLAPLMTKINEAGYDTENLYVYDPYNDLGVPDRDYGSRDNTLRLSPADEAGPNNILRAIGYLRKIVVLTSSAISLKKRIENDKDFQELFSLQKRKYYETTVHGECWLHYRVSKKKGERDAIKKIFTDRGYTVFDLVDVQPWEKSYVDPSKPKAVKEEKPKGMITFDNSVWDGGKKRTYANIKSHTEMKDPKRSEDIEAVTTYSVANDASSRYLSDLGYDNQLTYMVAEYLGDKIGICSSSPSYLKKVAEGKKPLEAYVVEKVTEYFNNSKEIQEYESMSLERIKSYLGLDEDNVKLCNFIWRNNHFKEKFGIKDNRSIKDKDFIYMKEKIHSSMRTHVTDDFKKMEESLKSIQPNPKLVQFVKHIRDSKWVGSLNISWLEEVYKAAGSNQKRLDALDEYVQMIFNY